ncbi:MAG TPA: SDR family oxidoreductase [Cyclobacteriaceae bacterium]|nr:SDR family oxidoreductase [Cyclobacteriaceae bacterium]
MEQKIAIVTGGSSGLGYATAKKFTENNIFTFVIGRDVEKLKKACSEFGKNSEAVVFDVTQLDKIPALVKRLADQKGRIDILVNNAGINQKKPLVDVTDEEFQKIIHTNVNSVFSFSREVSKLMIAQKSGCIINISSMAAQYGLPGVISYTASKTAIDGMTRAMAVELSPLGIRVNSIAPGFIFTKMSSAALDNDPQRKQKVLSRTPMGKLGMPEDVANTAYFLASDESSFLTGTVIPVDGGNSIGF